MQPANRRILCVDDTEDTRSMLRYLLAGADREVVTVSEARAALTLAHKESFDLYILDQNLPEMSGISLCREIREFDPHTPIIVFSSVPFESDRQEALRAGANVFVPKPCIDELMESVRHLLT